MLFIPFSQTRLYRPDPLIYFHALWLKRREFTQGRAFGSIKN